VGRFLSSGFAVMANREERNRPEGFFWIVWLPLAVGRATLQHQFAARLIVIPQS